MIGIACMALLAPFAIADETIILRDLSRIESSEFSFDEFEIRTSEGNVIYWDEVVSGEIRSDQQPSFDKILAKSGLPLFRLRHRISIGDHSSLPEIAEPQFQRLKDVKANATNCRHLLIVSVGCYYGRVAQGQRCKALIPLFRVFDLLKNFPPQAEALDTSVMKPFDREKEFSNNLVPIWFDSNQVLTVRKLLTESIRSTSTNQLSDGKLVYLASLVPDSTTQDNNASFMEKLAERNSEFARRWFLVLKTAHGSSKHANQLKSEYRGWKGSFRAAANYAVGTSADLRKDDKDSAVLDFLYVAANFSKQLPEISAASIYHAIKLLNSLDRSEEAKILRNKLFEFHKNTYHGRLGLQDF